MKTTHYSTRPFQGEVLSPGPDRNEAVEAKALRQHTARTCCTRRTLRTAVCPCERRPRGPEQNVHYPWLQSYVTIAIILS